MDWCLLFLSLWLCVTQGKSEDGDQRFYITVTKYEGDLTLEQCKTENAECLRRGDQDISELNCMCEDRYERAEYLRAECGDGGRNESAVRFLALENLPEKLGFCARAFANLGYRIQAVNSNNTGANITTYSDSELEAEVSTIAEFAREFWNLLDRTLVGVYLSSDQQRDICKAAYDEWLCSISLSLYSNTTSVSELKPCLSVCTRVVQQCPYYLPSRFQGFGDDETIYGGYPVFDCPESDILREYDKIKPESCGSTSCQIPYSLEQNCIGRDGTTKSLSAEILVLFVSIFCTASAF